MPEEFAGCSRAKLIKKATEEKNTTDCISVKEKTAMVTVGKPAPDFTAAGFHEGKFKKFTLSENLGKWVLLCFYPGDFTFV